MNCGVSRGRSLDLVSLWLWCRPVAVAPIRPRAWEPPCATGVTLKSKKTKTKTIVWDPNKENFSFIQPHFIETLKTQIKEPSFLFLLQIHTLTDTYTHRDTYRDTHTDLLTHRQTQTQTQTHTHTHTHTLYSCPDSIILSRKRCLQPFLLRCNRNRAVPSLQVRSQNTYNFPHPWTHTPLGGTMTPTAFTECRFLTKLFSWGSVSWKEVIDLSESLSWNTHHGQNNNIQRAHRTEDSVWYQVKKLESPAKIQFNFIP